MFAWSITLALLSSSPAGPAPSEAEKAFEALTGAELVWSRDELPGEVLFDRTPSLPVARRVQAAVILLREAKKYPPGFFERVSLARIGVFEACVSEHGDGFRTFEPALGGYRYYGQWAPALDDGAAGALIAAYYTDGQLPQTFHHEVFHHIDATLAGVVDHDHFSADDDRFHEAVGGTKPYAAPPVDAATRKALSRRSGGDTLEGALGNYAAKSAGEDQAETARWFMTHLPDALEQVVTRPELAGSQRILHLLGQYAGAAGRGQKADLAWFIAEALGRAAPAPAASSAPSDVSALALEPDAARAWLDAQAGLARRGATTADPDLIAQTTVKLVRDRIRPRDGDTRFTVWTPEQFQGGPNTVLQADLATLARDAARLGAWQQAPRAARQVLRRAQDELARLLEGYHTFIAANWDVSEATQRSFDSARKTLAAGLLDAPSARPTAPRPTAPTRTNPHLAKVAEAVDDPAWAAIIRGVQPAAVKIGQGSGVNLLASGLVLTNAHVAEKVGDVLSVTFPDGARYRGVTVASDHHADLALVRLEGAPDDLPAAPVARRAPGVGDAVCAIGQPGKTTPNGEATGYDGWHVSVGEIRGFLDDIYGPQSLGRTKHDAWTYWGHSGSPLFDRRGGIAALHNSWDSKTAMRHAVPHQVIVRFLRTHDVAFATR